MDLYFLKRVKSKSRVTPLFRNVLSKAGITPALVVSLGELG